MIVYQARAFRQARVENDDATCRLYGLTFGTPDYVQCRQNIINNRVANPGSLME
jgi:hypothetical protein